MASSSNRRQSPFEQEPPMWHVDRRGTFWPSPIAAMRLAIADGNNEPVAIEPVEHAQLHVAPGGTIIGRAVHTREDDLVEVQLGWRLPEFRAQTADVEWRAVPFEEALESLVVTCRQLGLTAHYEHLTDLIHLVEDETGKRVTFGAERRSEVWEFIGAYHGGRDFDEALRVAPPFTTDLDAPDWQHPGDREFVQTITELCRMTGGIRCEVSVDGKIFRFIEEETGDRVPFTLHDEWPRIADFIGQYRDYLGLHPPGDMD